MITKTYPELAYDYHRCLVKIGYNTFTVLEPSDDCIRFYKDGICKKVLVRSSDTYTYKFNKRSISAIDGEAGLYEFLQSEAKTTVGGYFHIVVNHVFEDLKI